MPRTDPLKVEHDAGVVWLTLNRPEAANALNLAMHEALFAALEAVRDEVETRAVVLAGAGERVFCAGADLKEVSRLAGGDAHASKAAIQHGSDMLLRTLLALLDFPKPLVCAVQGKAVGAGAMLALAADEIYAAAGASYWFPEISLGMPSPMSAVMLACRAPRNVVHRMVQHGARMEADKLLQARLVDAVVPDAQLRGHVRMLAAAALPGGAYGDNKRWINRELRQQLVAAASESKRLRQTEALAGGQHAT